MERELESKVYLRDRMTGVKSEPIWRVAKSICNIFFKHSTDIDNTFGNKRRGKEQKSTDYHCRVDLTDISVNVINYRAQNSLIWINNESTSTATTIIHNAARIWPGRKRGKSTLVYSRKWEIGVTYHLLLVKFSQSSLIFRHYHASDVSVWLPPFLFATIKE